MQRKKSKHKKAFEEFFEKAKEEFDSSLERLVLYGSVARDQEEEDSDVDVFAVVKNREQKKQLQNLAFEIGLKHGVAFSPVVKTKDEYRNIKDSTYGREVRSTGEIYV